MKEKLEKVNLEAQDTPTISKKVFDLFSMQDSTPEEMRAFEIWWNKMTGRSCIVIDGSVKYLSSLEYPEE